MNRECFHLFGYLKIFVQQCFVIFNVYTLNFLTSPLKQSVLSIQGWNNSVRKMPHRYLQSMFYHYFFSFLKSTAFDMHELSQVKVEIDRCSLHLKTHCVVIRYRTLREELRENEVSEVLTRFYKKQK